MNIKINTATRKNYAAGDQVIVKADEGRFTCKDESLLDILTASEGKTIEVEVEGTLIVGVTAPVETYDDGNETPFPESDADDEPQAPAPKKEEKKVFPKAPEKKKEETSAPVNAMTDSNSEPDDDEVATPVIAQKTDGLTTADELKVNTSFPLLRAEEIECRIGQFSKDGKSLTLLLYKNARCDQERLDAQYGPLGWQTEYVVIDGQLFCRVKIRDKDTGEWVSKMDIGTPSNTEPEKGRASDAFKRACVCWGSGRELYSAPEIKIYADKTNIKTGNNGKFQCYDKFVVKSIAYDEQRRISKLEIYGAHARGIVFKFSK